MSNKKPPLKIVGEHDQKTISQMYNCMSHGNAVAGALCADGHLGYSQPVGGAIAYEGQISVSGVGYDIGCGNLAVKLDAKESDFTQDDLNRIADDIEKKISFGMGRKNSERVDHDLFDSDLWKNGEVGDLKELARDQLGTVGSGNHYVDVFADEVGYIWIGVHFGSRGLGHKTATRYLALALGEVGIDAAPALLDEKSGLGEAYIAAMTLAGEYAKAGRWWVVNKVRQIIGCEAGLLESVHNHHNFAWQEEIGGRKLWVVRKGCTPAYPEQFGFVGGSMGDNAAIIVGRNSENADSLLFSTIHGAGRVCGRNEAKRRFTKEEMAAWLKAKNVILRGGDIDESPMAYRRLDDVLAYHDDSIDVLHRLKPLVVVMAGSRIKDHYRD